MSTISEHLVKQFAALFVGREDARGGVGGLCIREQVTLAHYRRHLDGVESLGIYPLRDDGTCRWIAVDLDRQAPGLSQEQIDHAALSDAEAICDALYTLGLNSAIYVELSKSKGAHVWVFFDGPVLAYNARRVLIAACNRAQVGKYELFPKQDEVRRGGVGNYINLPYFGNGPRRQMLEWKTWQPIPLEAFLAQVDRFPATSLSLVLENLPATPKSTRTTVPNGQYRTTTPCYDAMLSHEASEGERNDMATALAMHSNRIGLPQQATLSLLLDWNARNNPPLPEREIERVVESIYSKDYRSLWCEHRVVRPFCQSSCPVYKFAVAGRKEDDTIGSEADTQATGELRIEHLRIQTSNPPLYFVRVNGYEITLSGPVLANWSRFRLAVMEQARFLPTLPRGVKWDGIVIDLLDNAEEIEAPPEASDIGVIHHRIDRFIAEMPRTEEISDVSHGMLYVEDGHVWFRYEKLVDYLARHSQGEKLDHPELWNLLRRRGAVSTVKKIDGRSVRLWRLPDTASCDSVAQGDEGDEKGE